MKTDLTSTTTAGQSEIGSNINEGVLYTPQSSKTGTSPPYVIKCHVQDPSFGGVLPLCREHNQHILNPANRAHSRFEKGKKLLEVIASIFLKFKDFISTTKWIVYLIFNCECELRECTFN